MRCWPNLRVQLLNQVCFDERVQELISKIQHHLDVLEHSVARVSSRAEVFGAVQQVRCGVLCVNMVVGGGVYVCGG